MANYEALKASEQVYSDIITQIGSKSVLTITIVTLLVN